jgi:hypothetical protein
MITERAELEKAYSKSLKGWSKKWHEYLQKGNEYGTIKNAWASSLNEADRLSEIHVITHNALYDELNTEIKDWQKQNYPKSIINQLKTAKEYEEEFKKVNNFTLNSINSDLTMSLDFEKFIMTLLKNYFFILKT